MTDALTATTAAVDYEHWTTNTRGQRISQTSNPTFIRHMLGLLDLAPGMRVLEIGTGSGYSGALLATAVGETGKVVSIDVDDALIQRAIGLHRAAGHTHVEHHTADGMHGWQPGAPFDRIVAWTTPHLLPRAWVGQAASGAIVLTPVKIAPVADANLVLHCQVANGEPADGTLHPGGFIEMAAHVITEFGLPIRYVTASHQRPDGSWDWISAPALADYPGQAADLLAHAAGATPEPAFIEPDDFGVFVLYAAAHDPNPASIALANLPSRGIATTSPAGLATVQPDGVLIATGAADARARLTELRDAWTAAGKPTIQHATPTFTAEPDGWLIRTQYR